MGKSLKDLYEESVKKGKQIEDLKLENELISQVSDGYKPEKKQIDPVLLEKNKEVKKKILIWTIYLIVFILFVFFSYNKYREYTEKAGGRMSKSKEFQKKQDSDGFPSLK